MADSTEAALPETVVVGERPVFSDSIGAKQYLRKYSITITDPTGKTYDLSQLKSIFRIQQWDLQSPNIATVKIINAAGATAKNIMAEFAKSNNQSDPTRFQGALTIAAGYEGSYGTIFQGAIKQIRIGRDNQTDTCIIISASDGDTAYNYAVVETTLAAGSKLSQALQVCADALAKFGIAYDGMPDGLADASFIRGFTMSGMARDILRSLGNEYGFAWSILNGKLLLVKEGNSTQGDAVKLTSASGLIGMPEQTQEGILITCLLNPTLTIGRQVQIANATVNFAAFNLGYGGIPQNTDPVLPRVDEDGTYRIIAINWRGDTRGNDWYSDLVCIAVGDAPTSSAIGKGRS